MRDEAIGLAHHPVGELLHHARDRRSAAMVSASSPSAPIGVFNSWLTLATKSRRTLSTRRASDTSRVNATAPTTSPSRRSGNDRSWRT